MRNNLLRWEPSLSSVVKSIMFFRILLHGDVQIEDSFFMQLYSKYLYQGSELLFGNGYSFLIPKASPLKAS